jgi:hypothetical protein
MLEGLFAEIAEVADGIKRAFKFASSLDLKLDRAHWLFDVAVTSTAEVQMRRKTANEGKLAEMFRRYSQELV